MNGCQENNGDWEAVTPKIQSITIVVCSGCIWGRSKIYERISFFLLLIVLFYYFLAQ